MIDCRIMEDKPKRGILKSGNNYTSTEKIKKTVKWDELNIIQTSPPYNRYKEHSGKPSGYIIADNLSYKNNNKLNTEISTIDPESFELKIKRLRTGNSDENLKDSDATKEFERKRKSHSKEYIVAKLVKDFFNDEEERG
ncbi:uncharacterized protein LOC111623241 isoform X2 [Centruroides sculpturatus]|uniref:uncharacterized protein LOC111623241 isoform X2 n=1 Tax=Centruroides sculpturatus TaxID=218467 RepID=UPI000C6EB2BB|nr:uncharacterized protein LOC111623241 isoform X2 [Centruroides sculpturatus]